MSHEVKKQKEFVSGDLHDPNKHYKQVRKSQTFDIESQKQRYCLFHMRLIATKFSNFVFFVVKISFLYHALHT